MKNSSKKPEWVFFVALRYIFRKRGRSPSSVLAITGIATGVMSLIVILAVMNGFQLGFIESILEISSFHLRVENISGGKIDKALEILRNVPGIGAAIPFNEFQALVQGGRGGQQAIVIRGIPANAENFDPAMISRLDFEQGSFNLTESGSVLLGAELARRIGVYCGDRIVLYSISSIISGANTADDSVDQNSAGVRPFTVAGIFRTGFYEFDNGWGFVNIDSAHAFTEAAPAIGVKLTNRFQDRIALGHAEQSFGSLPDFIGLKFSSWRDYNKSFFGALRTEKLFMFILVGLIFIVVGLNIFQAQRRSVLERREEIGLLRAIGGAEWAVRSVFVLDGALIGFTGTLTGLLTGLFIAFNISGFFTVIEGVVNSVIWLLNFFASLFGAGTGPSDNFAVFSPAIFYIKEIPSRIIPGEVVIICLFGFLSALAAAWYASGKVSRIRPAEVLRYE